MTAQGATVEGIDLGSELSPSGGNKFVDNYPAIVAKPLDLWAAGILLNE